jgi:magnesium chelatase family protein
MVELETIAILGIQALTVAVQVEIVKTIPSFVIVGMVNRAINESKERIRGAFNSSALGFPNGKIIVNLSPADVLKEGSHYDLAIALGILKAMGTIKYDLCNVVIFGELSLNGDIIKTRGLLPAALYCYENNKKMIVHSSYYQEALNIFQEKSYLLYQCDSLRDIVNLTDLHHAGQQDSSSIGYISNKINPNPMKNEDKQKDNIDVYPNILGHSIVKRACALAVAGRHNIIMFGPPGSGKSIISRGLKNFSLALDRASSLLVSSIYSTAGLLEDNQLITIEPFRNPHHSISYAALLGGGNIFRPGEISLSHNGILFLDEIAEFSSQNLDMFRQVMEDRKIIVSRANYSIALPADFQLVATMNPCKCGYYGDTRKGCSCGYSAVQRYQKKISGPLLDRIDIRIFVSSEGKNEKVESGKVFYEKVLKARKQQQERYKKCDISYNSAIREQHVSMLNIEQSAHELAKKFVEDNFLSHRRLLKILAVARTVADFEESCNVQNVHILEAIFLCCKMNYGNNT